MNFTGNTILITGGGTGIGRGLAESLHKLGNQMVISGRRREVLAETCAANPGMKSMLLDIADAGAVEAFAAKLVKEFPALNMVIHNAGVMRAEVFTSGDAYLADAEAVVATNLLGPIRLTAALLPTLRQQAHSAIVTVSSGLAFVPLAYTPTYCATKAAIHSYTVSLRYQLKDTTTEVIEIIPPYVQTELMDGAEDPRAMPLKDFIEETMQLLQSEPTPAEVCVKNVHPLRFAAEEGRFAGTFVGLNGAMAGRFVE